ncbi:DUF2157 domain-containing protein [Lentzea flava]|uniref:DUF2157 domain-containing protein n=1 Tax=Lentzea flava TaxID=103732 RepID=A0ABQ2UT68_9PSEU|nr:DUF2157 domain-containing protein [Lentzea flava]MCP2197309.1 putative membrane protein (DUF2157) [Lentzea flava]GGU50040.1 hypothetical protein GCM10010178_48430 [Lentzea flava]
MAMTARQDQALHDLTTRGVLSADQESAVRQALEDTGAPRRVADLITELAAYVGGGLVLGGAALLLGLSWEDMSRLTRVAVLAAATVLLVVAAVVVAGGPVRAVAGLRRRVVSTLFSLAVVTSAFTAGTAVSSREFVVGATTGLVVAVVAYLLVPTALAYLALAAAAFATVIAWSTEFAADIPLVVGVALFVLGLIGALLSLVDVLRPAPLALAVGAAVALFGAQQPLGSNAWVTYSLTAGLAVACFAVYLTVRSTVLLVAGVVATTVVVPEVVWDLTDGAVGGGVLLLVAGAVLLATSLVSTWLRRTR